MLKEYKDDTYHFYEDEHGRKQGVYKYWYQEYGLNPRIQLQEQCFYEDGNLHGEYKYWHSNGQLEEHCYYKDGERHGEYKWWYSDGQIEAHHFFQNDNDITKEVTKVVSDINNITQEEKLLLKLKFGIECLC